LTPFGVRPHLEPQVALLEGFFDDDLSEPVGQVCERLIACPAEFQTFTWQGWAVAQLLANLGITDR
jgi:hypothetical protein